MRTIVSAVQPGPGHGGYTHLVAHHCGKSGSEKEHRMAKIGLPIRLVRNGGALWHKTNTLFRLPSTGYLVGQYYGYSRLLSRFEASMRIAWLFADKIIDLVQRDAPIDYIISVTRVTERIIAVVAEIVSHVTKRDVDVSPQPRLRHCKKRAVGSW